MKLNNSFFKKFESVFKISLFWNLNINIICSKNKKMLTLTNAFLLNFIILKLFKNMKYQFYIILNFCITDNFLSK